MGWLLRGADSVRGWPQPAEPLGFSSQTTLLRGFRRDLVLRSDAERSCISAVVLVLLSMTINPWVCS